MTAMFKHLKTQGLYTIQAQVLSRTEAGDMASVGILKTDHGYVAVQEPSLGCEQVATVQGKIEQDTRCLLYRGTDGRLWLRSKQEFTDGRFEPLNPQAACLMPPQWHFGSMAS